MTTSHPESTEFDSTAWSHPPSQQRDTPKYLLEHVHGVIDHGASLLTDTPALSDGTRPETLFNVIAYCHDIGKLTPWFQSQTLGNPNTPSKTPTHQESRNHSPLGAIATWYAARKTQTPAKPALAALMSVHRHHGSYPDLNHVLKKRIIENDRLWNKILPEQLAGINTTNRRTAEALLEKATDSTGSWTEFKTRVETGAIREQLKHDLLKQSDNPFIPETQLTPDTLTKNTYTDIIRLWGSLIHADTLDAAHISPANTPLVPHPETTLNNITNHIAQLPDAETTIQQTLNSNRETARQEVISNIHQAPTETNYYELSLPTGLGKTLTGLTAAITHRNQPETVPGQIIYALPYTSIVDQTATTLQTIFNTTSTGTHLTVHHHLRETKTNLDETYTSRTEYLAGETWLTDLTLTTFVQLFESLTGPTKREGYKTPRLHNSIIILDEPQLLSLSWWPLINTLIDTLTTHFNATVISMTATQPAVMQTHDAYSLIDTPRKYVTDYPRTTYTLDDSLTPTEPNLSTDTAAERILNEHASGENTLAICNTITSAQTTSQTLTELASRSTLPVENLNQLVATQYNTLNGTGTKKKHREGIVNAVLTELNTRDPDTMYVCQLTSRHRPCDRMVLLELLNELEPTDHTVITISTQLIEAGVDLSFNRIYRDFAPIDSIVQAGGRCNRAFESGVNGGVVTVWQLAGDTRTAPSNAVYSHSGVNLLDVSVNALTTHTSIPCANVSADVLASVVETYHELLQNRLPDTDGLVSALESVNGEELNTASMIESPPTCEIIVQCTTTEEELVAKYREAVANGERDTAKQLLTEIQLLTVGVPVYDDAVESSIASALTQVEDTGLYSSPRRTSRFYSFDDGVSVPESTAAERIL